MVRRFWLLVVGLAATFASVGCAARRATIGSPSGGAAEAPYHYLRGGLELLAHRPMEALASLDQALESDPKNPYILSQRATISALVGELARAEADCRAALSLYGDEGDEAFDTLFLLGKILQSQERRPEAIEIYRRALKLQPHASEVWYLLVETHVAEKDDRGALREIAAWRKETPDDLTPLFYEAAFHQNARKRPLDAIGSYKQILALEPENLRALSALGELYLSRDQDEKALQVFREIEALNPEDLSVSLKIALIYYEAKRTPQAIGKFREILEAHSESDRIRYYLAVIYENVGRKAEAVEEFAKIPEGSGHYRDARLHMAYLAHQKGDDGEAFRILEEAIGKRPEIAAFYQYQAELHRRRRDFPKAIDVLKEALGKSREKESLFYTLGTVYDHAGLFEESMGAMRRVLEINPDNASALNYIGYSYADRGERLDEALSLIEKALLLKPDDGYITDSLGWVWFQKGELDQAFLYCWKAYQAVPKEPTIAEHLGDIFLKKDEANKAMNYFKESLKFMEKDQEEDHSKAIERVRVKIDSLKKLLVP